MSSMRANRTMQPYQRVAEAVRQLIRAETLQPHDKLPPARELATTHGVSIGVVQRALERLRDQGVLYAHQGRGTFVAESSNSDEESLGVTVRRLEERVSDLTARVERIESKE